LVEATLTEDKKNKRDKKDKQWLPHKVLDMLMVVGEADFGDVKGANGRSNIVLDKRDRHPSK
jgi:hypothetical protein